MDIPKEFIKRHGWSLLGAIGIITFWRGIWEGASYIPIINNLWVSLLIGLVIITITAYKYSNNYALNSCEKIMTMVDKHELKHRFQIHYHDKIENKENILEASKLHLIEKGFARFKNNKGVMFHVPLERIMSIQFDGKPHWIAHRGHVQENSQ